MGRAHRCQLVDEKFKGTIKHFDKVIKMDSDYFKAWFILKLAIVSEFGEELGEHRMTIIGALNTVFPKNDIVRYLTGDITNLQI